MIPAILGDIFGVVDLVPQTVALRVMLICNNQCGRQQCGPCRDSAVEECQQSFASSEGLGNHQLTQSPSCLGSTRGGGP